MRDPATLFHTLACGVHVVGVANGERRGGFTAAWVMQVSFDPPLLAVSANPGNASFGLLMSGEGFVVNVLRKGQLDLARHFGTRSGREQDKLAGIPWRPAGCGAPILEDALAFLECRPTGSMPAGDHVLVLGVVVDGDVLAPGAEPLTYADTGDMDGSAVLYPDVLQGGSQPSRSSKPQRRP